jgi:hypothetical protein
MRIECGCIKTWKLAIFGAAMLVTLGAYLLWTDFIAAPLSSRSE